MPPEWYALESIEDAFEDTKDLLTPFSLSIWGKLALITLFIGGSMANLPTTGPTNFDGGTNSTIDDFNTDDFSVNDLEAMVSPALAIGLVFGLIGLLIIKAYLSGLFRFIYFQNLENNLGKEKNEIRIIKSFKDNLGPALRYFGVFLGVISLGLIGVLGIIGSFFINPVLGIGTIFLSIPLWIIIGLSLFFLRAVLIPEMLLNNKSGIEGLRQVYGYVLSEWKQAGIYLLVKSGLNIVLGILWTIAFIIGIFVIGIPFAILGVALFAVSEVLVAIPIVLGVLSVIVYSLFIEVPVSTFGTHYALDVYKRFAEEE